MSSAIRRITVNGLATGLRIDEYGDRRTTLGDEIVSRSG
jgi:hypothetical protein